MTRRQDRDPTDADLREAARLLGLGDSDDRETLVDEVTRRRQQRADNERVRQEQARRAAAQVAELRRDRQRAAITARSAGDPMVEHAGRDELVTMSEARGRVPDVADIYARLIITALERAQLLGAQLAAEYAEIGLDALVRDTFITDPDTGELVPDKSRPTALVLMEGQERDRLERLIQTAVRLQLDHKRAGVSQEQGRLIVTTLRKFAEARGIPWADDDVRRDAQGAALSARAELAEQLERPR